MPQIDCHIQLHRFAGEAVCGLWYTGELGRL